jgi:DNA modification methylase
VFCPAGAGRHPWGFKQFLPVLLYGASPTVSLGKGATCATAITSSELPTKDSKAHPVPKPVGWMTWSVQLASRPGETVLDPFMGSGTTGVACVKLGRKFIGIEVDEGYFELACDRLRKAHAQADMFFSVPALAPGERYAPVEVRGHMGEGKPQYDIDLLGDVPTKKRGRGKR